MTMKEDPILPRALELEPYRLMQFSVVTKTSGDTASMF